MVGARVIRAAWAKDANTASVSGVRRLDLDDQATPLDSSLFTPDAGPELERALAELAATRTELAETKAELARLRATVEALQQPVAMAPAPASAATEHSSGGSAAAHATLQHVLVTAAASPADTQSGRRQAERHPCEFEVEFAHDTHFFAGVSSDMSTGGLFVATYQSLPVGTAVAVAFDLPSGHRVEARGEVRWTRETERGDSRPGVGIAFTDLPAAALAHIVEFCREKPPLCFDV